MKPIQVTSRFYNSTLECLKGLFRVQFFYCVLCTTLAYCEGEAPHYLIPSRPGVSAPSESRSTYESLTEPRGSLKVTNDTQMKVEKESKGADEKAPSDIQDDKALALKEAEGPVINVSNVSITEMLKYVGRLTGKNFIYDPQELQFNITMVSDSSSSLSEVVAMVIQSLRAHGYSVLEEGDNYIIHTNTSVRSAAALENQSKGIAGPQIATRVFVLQNLGSDQCSAVIKAMVTEGAIVESVGDARVVVSDVTENLNRIAEVIRQMDTTTGGLEIGQYVAINSSPATLVSLTERILAPIAGDRPLVLVPHSASNSVFIVSTPFLIEKSLSIMQATDLNITKSGLLDQLRFDKDADERARLKKMYEASQNKGTRGQGESEAAGAITDDDVRRYLLEQGIMDAEITPEILEAAKRSIRESKEQQFFENDFGSSNGRIPSTKKHFAEGDMPLGTVEATKFLIYRLQYRKSSELVTALRSIAASLSGGGKVGGNGRAFINPELANSDLIITLNSLQPVDDNNTIVFTGSTASLQRARDLIQQIDIPVRQVYIEALVLDTTISNSLNFGVEWAGKIERTNLGAGIGFRDPNNNAFGTAFGAITQTTPNPLLPPPSPGGFSTGFMGRKIKFLGMGFRSTGALVTALQADSEIHIIMNPKIVTEHNVPAEIFVGQQTPIKGQSIANSSVGSTSSIVATNYETQETGISLKVTPLISSKDTVTLIIEQKVSSVNQAQVNSQGQNNAPPATVKETRTVTRVHLPSEHFLVISGMIGEDTDLEASRIPCLGGLPVVGALFGTKDTTYDKRNLMIFIRPVIVDTPNDIDEITKAQENIMKQKSVVQSQGWHKEVDSVKSLLNIDPSIF